MVKYLLKGKINLFRGWNLTSKLWVLYLELKPEQDKLDWPVFILRLHKNRKNNFLIGQEASGKVMQLFLEA